MPADCRRLNSSAYDQFESAMTSTEKRSDCKRASSSPCHADQDDQRTPGTSIRRQNGDATRLPDGFVDLLMARYWPPVVVSVSLHSPFLSHDNAVGLRPTYGSCRRRPAPRGRWRSAAPVTAWPTAIRRMPLRTLRSRGTAIRRSQTLAAIHRSHNAGRVVVARLPGGRRRRPV